MQNGVTISTKESELEIKYGMINFREEREGARTSLRYILHDMNDIRTRYIRLGFHLEEFRRCGYYYDFGYSTMEEFCGVNLGLDKSAVSRCINVYLAFNASKSVVYENGVKKVGSAMDLSDEWKDYSYSQLCEMVSMNDEQRSQVKPDMTIKQIREIKKQNVSRDVSPVATSQPEGQKEGEVYDIHKFTELKGIVRQNYIKNLSGKRFILDIFDESGKRVFNGPCCLFCHDSDFLRVRLEGSPDGIESIENLKEGE